MPRPSAPCGDLIIGCLVAIDIGCLAPNTLSGAGLDLEHGLTTSRRLLADTLNAARAVAKQTVALVDAGKFGRASLVPIAGATEFDLVVTDAGLDDDVAEEYARAGVKLDVAPGLADDE